ncbi:FtsB family cell division protein [Bacilliculturomica massiliensis]|uniref:FtsB family cell division protein n=1 Tax=Bacilliculturomica massiliensis TaxID=1917867 RepID=UPI00102FE672|nr:septum formation initiator family protein [Bacilliculturomica massiliensis]
MGKKRRSRAFKENKQVIDFEEERQRRREKRKQLTEKKKSRQETEVPSSPRRTGKKVRRRLIYCAVFLVFVCVIGYSVYNIVTLQAKRAETAEAVALLEKQKEQMEKEYSLVDSDEYIEEKARGDLHMIRQGEKIYVLPGDDGEGAPAVSEAGLKTASNGALQVTVSALDGFGEEDDWVGSMVAGLKDTWSAVVEQIKDLVRK